MLLRRFTQHVKEQNWFAVGLDFIIVVLGVFIGLQVANWNGSRAEAKREAFYITALHEDFGSIIAELEIDIARYETIANAMNLLMEQSRLPAPDVSLDELNDAARFLTAMEGTPIVSDTYLNLTGSGDLAIIRNAEVKTAINAFFRQVEVIKLVGNTHELQLVNVFQPYIIAHLDYSNMLPTRTGLELSRTERPEQILAVLGTDEFRNIAAVKWDIVTDIRGLLETALTEAKTVNELLTDEMERMP